jgi:hypothetical protein
MTLLLAKALKALRKGVDALIKWNDRNDSWSRLFADCDEVKNIKFQYVLKLVPDKPLFKVNLNSGQSRVDILKIARTYNIEMHLWCATCGLAPAVIA